MNSPFPLKNNLQFPGRGNQRGPTASLSEFLALHSLPSTKRQLIPINVRPTEGQTPSSLKQDSHQERNSVGHTLEKHASRLVIKLERRLLAVNRRSPGDGEAGKRSEGFLSLETGNSHAVRKDGLCR